MDVLRHVTERTARWCRQAHKAPSGLVKRGGDAGWQRTCIDGANTNGMRRSDERPDDPNGEGPSAMWVSSGRRLARRLRRIVLAQLCRAVP
jgi:hypothetical protein